MKRIKKKNSISKPLAITMVVLTLFITSKGLSASLNQKNLGLREEVAELASTNQWIKYQISDKMSLDKIEAYARNSLAMTETAHINMNKVSVDLDKINQTNIIATDYSWMDKLQKNVGDIFDGH